MPRLKDIIRKRHPKTHILDGEFVKARDGKMRYFKPLRIELYQGLKTLIDDWSKDPLIYLCMESDQIWEKGLGWTPGNSAGLALTLDNRVRTFFG
jgi:spore photoproduct lyase